MIHGTRTLRYYLLSGSANLEPFGIFGSQQITWQGYQVTFYVLGTSHAVALDRRGPAFTELLSCAPEVQARPVHESAVDALQVVSRTIGDIHYRCRLTLFDLTDENDLDGEFEEGNILAHNFDPAGGSDQPVTRIGWSAGAAQLLVETLHTYPEEGRGVRSQSLFRPPETSCP